MRKTQFLAEIVPWSRLERPSRRNKDQEKPGGSAVFVYDLVGMSSISLRCLYCHNL